jgi:hypothetical protein
MTLCGTALDKWQAEYCAVHNFLEIREETISVGHSWPGPADSASLVAPL